MTELQRLQDSGYCRNENTLTPQTLDLGQRWSYSACSENTCVRSVLSRDCVPSNMVCNEHGLIRRDREGASSLTVRSLIPVETGSSGSQVSSRCAQLVVLLEGRSIGELLFIRETVWEMWVRGLGVRVCGRSACWCA